MNSLELGALKFNPPFTGIDHGTRSIETTVSGGLHSQMSKDTLGDQEPSSLIHNMVRMARRDSAQSIATNSVTVRKEVYISEESL
jgi:hypothetical protein